MTEHVTWDEVGRRFTELGRALKAHAPEPTAATPGDPPPPPPGRASTGAASSGTTGSEGVDHALAQVTDALNRLSVSVSEAVEDPAVRDAARTAVHGVGAALSLTLDEIADAINRSAGQGPARGSTGRTGGDAGSDAPPEHGTGADAPPEA